MATSVNAAFDEFLRNTVNIPKTESDNAKKSRDFLLSQIKSLCDKGSFFKDDPSCNVFYG